MDPDSDPRHPRNGTGSATLMVCSSGIVTIVVGFSLLNISAE
jgi:hypothetical protein